MCKYHKVLIKVVQAHKELICADEKLLKRALVYLEALHLLKQSDKDLVDLILGIRSVLASGMIGGDK